MFLVPINAALQDIGHRTIGSGRAVALQSFFENFAMLTGVGIYTASVSLGAQPVASLVVVGVLVLIATTLVSWHLPPDPVDEPNCAAVGDSLRRPLWLGWAAFVEDDEPAAVGLALPNRVEARSDDAFGVFHEARREREVAGFEHFDLVRIPRERRARASEERLPRREHGLAAAERCAAREEHGVFGHVAAERREVALRHAARERALGGEDLGATRFEGNLSGRHAGEQGRHDDEPATEHPRLPRSRANR